MSWYPRNDLNYQESCGESMLLLWLRDDVRASFFSLPGRMKIATMMVNALGRLMWFGFIQACVNAFAFWAATTKLSENDESMTLMLWNDIQFGFIATDIFNLQFAAGVLIIRWEMNRWICWYKMKTVAVQASSRLSECGHIEVVVVEDGMTSLMEPLIQSEAMHSAEEGAGNRSEGQQVKSFCSVQQVSWYLAAVGCIVSWIAVVSRIEIYKMEYAAFPIPGELFSCNRSASVYDFVYDQYLYSYDSIVMYSVVQMFTVALVCFLIPSAIMIMMICLVIEMRKDHIGKLRTRKLVCALQYLRCYNGGESILFAFIVMYFEITRIFEKLVTYEVDGETYYITAKFIFVPGTWFFMTFYVSNIFPLLSS